MKRNKKDITTLEAVLIVIVVILLTLTIWVTYAWQSEKNQEPNFHGYIGGGSTIEEAEENMKPY